MASAPRAAIARTVFTSLSFILLGVLAFAATAFIGALIIFGTVRASQSIYPILHTAYQYAFGVLIFILLPLSLIRPLRFWTGVAIFFSSYLFGALLWTVAVLFTMNIWGALGLSIGLFMAGVGVVPVAMLATAINGHWSSFWNLVFGLALTIGTRVLGIHLSRNPPAWARSAAGGVAGVASGIFWPIAVAIARAVGTLISPFEFLYRKSRKRKMRRSLSTVPCHGCGTLIPLYSVARGATKCVDCCAACNRGGGFCQLHRRGEPSAREHKPEIVPEEVTPEWKNTWTMVQRFEKRCEAARTGTVKPEHLLRFLRDVPTWANECRESVAAAQTSLRLTRVTAEKRAEMEATLETKDPGLIELAALRAILDKLGYAAGPLSPLPSQPRKPNSEEVAQLEHLRDVAARVLGPNPEEGSELVQCQTCGHTRKWHFRGGPARGCMVFQCECSVFNVTA